MGFGSWKKLLSNISSVASIRTTKKREKARVDRFFNLSLDLLCISGLDGYFKRLNPAWEKTLGFSQSELLAKPFIEFVHPEDREATIAAANQLQTGSELVSFENRYLCKDGSYKWLLWNAAPYPEEGLIYAVAHDITERKQTEQTLQHLVSILETTTDFIGTADMEGRTLYLNQTARQMLGMSADEDISKVQIADCHPEWALKIVLEQGIPGAIRDGAWSGETAIKSNDGREIPVSQVILAHKASDGSPEFLSTVVRDISDRKQTETALRQSLKEVFDIKLALDRAAIVAITDSKGRITYVNDKFCQISQYSRSELMGQDHRIVNSGYHPKAFFKGLWSTILAGEVWKGEIKNRAKDGSYYWVDTTIIPILDDAGKTEHYLSIRFDISPRKRMEQALKQANETLENQVDKRTAELSYALRQLEEQIAERREAEAALQESESRLNSILNSLKDVVWSVSASTSEVLFMNPAAETVYGYSPQEFFQKPNLLLELIHPEDRDRAFAADQKVMEEGSGEIEYRIIRPDRQVRWIHYRAWLIYDEIGNPVRMDGLASDISDRKQAEAALQQSETRFRKLAQREELLNRLASNIHNSLDVDTILETTVQEIHNLLKLDRCNFAWYRAHPDPPTWEVVTEARTPALTNLLGQYPVKANPLRETFLNLEILCFDELKNTIPPELQELYRDWGYTAFLALPIQIPSGEMGMLSCGSYSSSRHWSEDDIALLQAIADQLAIALYQAELYTQAQESARLAQQQTQQLQQTLHQLQQTQTQLIQTEKMSGLGQLVAGVAHEINNPVNFIYGNLTHTDRYTQDLLKLINLYQHYYPNPPAEIQETIEDIDLDFLTEDLPKLLSSMQIGTDRIRQIVLSLRNFSRLDEADMKEVNIHEGIDNTLLLLQNRLKARPDKPGIEIVKEYSNLPLIECYAGQLNQVFMNILNNAIDALEMGHGTGRRYGETTNSSQSTIDPSSMTPFKPMPTIRIRTEIKDRDWIVVKIADNGPGMTETVQSRLFDPFFTTKPVGKGTGLGLSISYQIVVQKHGGVLRCSSQPDRGAEFWIEIPIRQGVS